MTAKIAPLDSDLAPQLPDRLGVLGACDEIAAALAAMGSAICTPFSAVIVEIRVASCPA